MTREQMVVDLYAKANPVPSVDDLGLDREQAIEHLATLERRSSEVTQLETREKQAIPQGRSRAAWLVAAVALLVVGVAVVLLNRDEPIEAVDTPTTVVATPTTLAADPLAGFPPFGALGGEGTFTAARSDVPYAFTVTKDWLGHPDATAERLALCRTTDIQTTYCEIGQKPANVAVLKLEFTTVEETRDFLATMDGALLSDIEETEVGGAMGIRFTYENDVPVWPSEQTRAPFPVIGTVTPGGGIPIGHGEQGRAIITIVDVAGTPMTLVYQGYSQDRGNPNDGFNEYFEEGMAIIDSIVWGDLS